MRDCKLHKFRERDEDNLYTSVKSGNRNVFRFVESRNKTGIDKKVVRTFGSQWKTCSFDYRYRI